MNKCKRKFDLRKCKLMTVGLQWMKRWKKGGGFGLYQEDTEQKKGDKKVI